VPVQRQLVDTNVLARFFTGEPHDMALKARRLVERADNGEIVLVLLPVIVAELIYTLESYYELDRKEVASKLLSFLQSRGVEAAEEPRVTDALTRCRDFNAHFADAYLAAAAVELHHPVASFDRDFDKFKDVQRIEPKGS
jgi:predicted nucleic acid-binding protein